MTYFILIFVVEFVILWMTAEIFYRRGQNHVWNMIEPEIKKLDEALDKRAERDRKFTEEFLEKLNEKDS